MNRRAFLQASLAGAGAAGLMLPRAVWAQEAVPGAGPYGSIEGRTPDANGLILPEGFSSRVVATSGLPVADTGYLWHAYPDGAACFPIADGGWTYVCNSEVFLPRGRGGVSAVRFGPDGTVLDAGRILEGSTGNCAGGPTPWGAWLSCEEFDTTGGEAEPESQPAGMVWETDPTRTRPAIARPAMGLFSHEAAAVDPVDQVVYMTEDQFDGLLYRFTPTSYPDLSAGVLQAASIDVTGDVRWLTVPDPAARSASVRAQVPDATRFQGGEGLWHHDGVIFFTTKWDGKLHAIHLRDQRYELIYDQARFDEPILDGLDNVTVDAGSGDVFVAEDTTDPLELVVISAERELAVFCRLDMALHAESEITGPCFNPDGTRLYFSSQRGGTEDAPAVVDSDHRRHQGRKAGITYEVSGPFRGAIRLATPPTPAATPSPKATESQPTATVRDDDSVPLPTETIAGAVEEDALLREQQQSGEASGSGFRARALIGLGAGAAAIGGAAVWATRRRQTPSEDS